MKKSIPAISIVIPMYNVEKYIGECLDSILAQTFQDFEVIVVDDCSTDNSCEIVESYMPKFNTGRDTDKLKLIRREYNSGSAGTPRNIGISLARGEYLAFIDSDDMITKTALEEIYPIAKKFDADVVHCDKFVQFNDGEGSFILTDFQRGEFVEEPTLITDDLAARIKDMWAGKYSPHIWSKWIRRDFILENNIRTVTAIPEDALISICVLCSAKRYVRVPNVVNIYRNVEESISHKQRDVSETIDICLKAFVDGFKVIENFLNERENFFSERQDLRIMILDAWERRCDWRLNSIYMNNPVFKLDEPVKKVFEGNSLMSFLFNRMKVCEINMNKQGAIIHQMNAQIQKHAQVIQSLVARLKSNKNL